jgi:hydroxymethylpyrimidine/phosphomethylpyrimidine kinase
MSGEVRNVLSIAGSDPSGGAGIQADLKTFAALGVYGCAVITALTAQNTVEVSAVLPVPADFLRRQLETVFSDVRVDAVKIGMLGSVDAVRTVIAALRAYRPAFVVVDPVLRASTGARLLDADALDALRDELFPLATVVTPNAVEVGALLGIEAPRSIAEAREAAGSLTARGVRAALVTGGHLADADVSVDVLHDGREIRELRVSRIHSARTHGTGCTLSSAIAALLARGHGLPQACAEAQQFVAASITRGADLRVGRGVGPVHQLGALWDRADRPHGSRTADT